MALSRIVSEINGDFGRKSKIFQTPVHFATLLNVSPWNWVSALGCKNYNDGATGPNKKFDDIFSRVDTRHQRDKRTDGHTGRQQRPRLRIAPCDKNDEK